MVKKLRSRPVFVGALVLALLALTVFANEWPAAPTAADMLADDTVSDAIDDAWDDSDAGDKDKRHEEGGWILQCRRKDPYGHWEYYFCVERVAAGTKAGLTPGAPPEKEDCRVVGFFHTHPNPPTDEDGNKWEQGPSDADKNWHNRHKIPGIVRNAGGNETFGPDSGVYE